MKVKGLLLILIICFLANGLIPHASADNKRPNLVLQITVDQLRGDLPMRFKDIIGSKPKPHEGVSPRNLLATTIGDELVVGNGGQSRVFSVSVKDRGAILPGGRVGKAFWFSKSSGGFVTSTYYYDDYPEWVKQWNAAKPADRYKGKTWDLLYDRSSYVAGDIDDRPYEASFAELGRTFPHALGDGSAKYFYLVPTLTPMGDELTLDFAKTLIENEKMQSLISKKWSALFP